MQNSKILQYLEELAFQLGIEIVNERLGGTDVFIEGGLCKVKGTYKIFMDPSTPIQNKIEVLARSLSSFHTENVYLLPFIREILQKAKTSQQ
jgi:hypothetical protein